MNLDHSILPFEKVKDHIENYVEYPDVEFQVLMSTWEGPYVRILYSLPDNFNPGEKTVLGINSFLPPFFNLLQIDAWLQWRMWRIEGHEARERFVANGDNLFNPHDSGANALA